MILLFSLLSFTISTYAVESFPFIGVTIETHTIDLKSSSNLPSEHEKTIGIRYGRQTLDWRTMFTLSLNSDYTSFAMEIDKILLDSMFGMPELRPYIGATVGYIKYDAIPNIDTNEGLFYGANAGFLIYATDTIDTDISYHYYFMDSMNPLNTFKGVTLGVHYFY